MSAAMQIMRRLNPNALVAMENGREVFIEDVSDPDGNLFRLEYRVDPTGDNALAYCLYSPHPKPQYQVTQTHLMSDGSICTTANAHTVGDPLEHTVMRARFWCTAYSFLCQHGLEATRAALGNDW